MRREAVADKLEEIGLLLELLGENPFKTRAYDNGARIVRGLDSDLAELVARKELIKVKGIGAALAEKIATLVTTGQLPYLDALHAKVPEGLLDWLNIAGLGAKKARAIHVALGISTLDELEVAAKEGKLAELPGFGKTSQEKILAGIERLRTHAGRFLRPVILAEATRLLELVRAVPGIHKVEVGGSVRRCSETSKDIDLVVTAKDPEAVMEAFAGDEGVMEIIGRGPTKCSVRLGAGPSADLRVVPDESFACALMYFTGSKAHNIAIRGRAQKLGLRLNEYALTREEDGSVLPTPDEAAIYKALGIPHWIPPEIREDQGEIEAACDNALPTLIETGDIQGVLHVHSSWSDGNATIDEMADAARAMGLHYLAMCDHSKTAAYAGGLTVDRLRQQAAEIDDLNAKAEDGFRILKGTEVDILPDGSLDFPDEVLRELDIVVASVHSNFTLSEEKQTARIIKAMENPYVDIVGHVTGRILLQRDGYPLQLNKIIDAAADRGISVEINAHPSRLDLDWSNLRYALKRGMKSAIDPDSHSPEGLHDIRYGVDVARKAWCGPQDIINAWPLEKLQKHLAQRRRDAGVGR